MQHHRYAWVLLGLGALVGLGWYSMQHEPPATRTTAAPASQAPTAALADAAALPAIPAHAASPVARGPTSAELAALRDSIAQQLQQLKQIEAQWCSHGQQAHAQSMASVEQSHPINPGHSDAQRSLARAEATNALSTTRARYMVKDRLQREWVAKLRARGDSRSLATASFLERKHVYGDERRALEARLEAQALGSSDPYVLQLWLLGRNYCAFGDPCPPQAKARWTQIEPENLLAWLPTGGSKTPLTDAQWSGISNARYARSHHYELLRRLLALLADTKPSLELEVGLESIELLRSSHGTSVGWLERHCQETVEGSVQRKACLHAAELVWNNPQPSWGDRTDTLGIVVAQGATQQPLWGTRIAELMSMGEVSAEVHRKTDYGLLDQQLGCDKLPARRQKLLNIAEGGAWLAAERTLKAQGARTGG
jgi:hypothetical protein